MERYITADEAMHELEKVFMPNDFPKIVRAISSTRTAEVRLDIRAHWLKEEHFGGIFKCSNCGQYVDFKGLKGTPDPTNFCPHCGAEMAREA